MTRLYRNPRNQKIAGICGGLAEAYPIDANLLRMLVVFLGLATGAVPMLIAYAIGWILIPAGPPESGPEAR